MLPLDYALAVAFLTTPADPTGDLNYHYSSGYAVKAVCVHWQVLDDSSTIWFRGRSVDPFHSDVRILRGMLAKLQDAPPVTDAMLFPPLDVIEQAVADNRSRQKFLDATAQLELVYAAEVAVLIERNQQLYRMWDAVRDARRLGNGVYMRREGLQRLRNLIGEDAYYRGQLVLP